MRTGTTWLLGLAFAGCGAAAPRGISEAIPIFERFWHEQLLPGLEEPKKAAALTLGNKVPGHLHAGASTFEQFRRDLGSTLTPAERRTAILYESPEPFPAAGACWAVESSGGFGSEIRACLDPRTGRVLSVWIVPEG